MRTAVTLAGNADKLVFTPDISTENTTARVAEMCGKAIFSERYVKSINLGTSVNIHVSENSNSLHQKSDRDRLGPAFIFVSLSRTFRIYLSNSPRLELTRTERLEHPSLVYELKHTPKYLV